MNQQFGYPMGMPFGQQSQPVMYPQQMMSPVQDDYFATGVKWVEGGRAEVDRIVAPRGSRLLFMDKDEPIFYVKETDMYGTSKSYVCKFSEVGEDSSEQDGQNQYVTLSQLEDILNDWKEKYESVQ